MCGLLDHHGCCARNDDVHLEAYQVGGEARKALISSLRPPVLDTDISPLGVAKLVKALPERLDEGIGWRTWTKDPNARDLPRRLRLSHERYDKDAPTHEGDERSPVDHWIT
jgi:hypothetical protein